MVYLWKRVIYNDIRTKSRNFYKLLDILILLGLKVNDEFKIKGDPYTYRINKKYHIEINLPNHHPNWNEYDALQLADLKYGDIVTLNIRE